MLSLLSTLGGLLISGLPKLLDYFQNKADQKHELALAQIQTERELQMAAQGFIAQQKVEEIRTDQIAMQTDAQMTEAALKHDEKVLERASTWVVNFVGTVRPVVTYIFVLELCSVNAWIAYYVYSRPTKILSDACKGVRAIVTCPHCEKQGGGGNMRRYHFDKCKAKK